jgi:hypothetical protein
MGIVKLRNLHLNLLCVMATHCFRVVRVRRGWLDDLSETISLIVAERTLCVMSLGLVVLPSSLIARRNVWPGNVLVQRKH